MSLSNHLTEIARNGQPWEKFEMESFGSHALSGKRNKTDFIQLQTPDTEKEDFIPLEKGGDNPEKRKEAEDILQEAREKAALLEQEAYEKGFAQGEKDGLELGDSKAV
jgi:flagellar biosynthesis/type III secretory pathway protein FliH